VSTAPVQHPPSGALRGFAEGVGLLARGFRVWATSPRLMMLGMVPGIITFAIIAAVVVVLVINLDAIARGLTPFAAGWDEPWAGALRVVVGLAILGTAGLVLAYTFTVVTLAIGQPFFESIAKVVDDSLGGVAEEVVTPFWRGLLRGIGEAVGILLLTLLIGAGLFLLGLIPLVGTIIAATIGAFTGGWFLALELTAAPFERRGLRFPERRRMLGARRSVTLGFGVAVFLLFLIPLGAVVTMPAAVAGGTLLSRRMLGEPTRATS
jgi:CysZ protein